MKIKIDRQLKIVLLQALKDGYLDTDLITASLGAGNEINPFIFNALANGYISIGDIPKINEMASSDPFKVMRILHGIDEND